jgi:hypothetical protein
MTALSGLWLCGDVATSVCVALLRTSAVWRCRALQRECIPTATSSVVTHSYTVIPRAAASLGSKLIILFCGAGDLLFLAIMSKRRACAARCRQGEQQIPGSANQIAPERNFIRDGARDDSGFGIGRSPSLLSEPLRL